VRYTRGLARAARAAESRARRIRDDRRRGSGGARERHDRAALIALMRRGAKLATVAVGAFLVVVIARFPARWAAGALPAGTTCLKLSGTLWSGTCAGLMQAGAPVGDLTWRLRPLRLLTGSLSADVVLARGSGMASGRVDIGPSGAVTAHGLRVAFPLDRALVPALPPGMQGSV